MSFGGGWLESATSCALVDGVESVGYGSEQKSGGDGTQTGSGGIDAGDPAEGLGRV